LIKMVEKGTVLRITLLLVILSLIIVTISQGWLEDFVEWADETPTHEAAFALGAVYIVATAAFIPGSILTLAAGFILGIGWGFVTVWFSATIGATAAFFLGRTIAREWAEKLVEKNEKFSAIQTAIGEEEVKVMFLLRLAPLAPFNLLNPILGTFPVSLKNYVLTTFFGIAPGTMLYVYFGSTLGDISGASGGDFDKGPEYYVVIVATIVIAIGVVAYITKKAKQILAKTVQQTETKNNESALMP